METAATAVVAAVTAAAAAFNSAVSAVFAVVASEVLVDEDAAGKAVEGERGALGAAFLQTLKEILGRGLSSFTSASTFPSLQAHPMPMSVTSRD